MLDRMFYEEHKREENWKIPVMPFYIGEHLDKKGKGHAGKVFFYSPSFCKGK